MTTYGYAIFSTDCQSLTSQAAELHAAGCAKVYAEKISGARSNRPELAKVLKRLDTGDVLIVTRLDRLARSTRDLLNSLDDIAKRGAGFKSLDDAWAKGGPGCLNRFSASISGASAGVRLPSGVAAG